MLLQNVESICIKLRKRFLFMLFILYLFFYLCRVLTQCYVKEFSYSGVSGQGQDH